MGAFNKSIDEIIEFRGGKKRVPGVPEPVTFYVDKESYADAFDNGYIQENGIVTDKFVEEYLDMFDVIGKIVQ